MARHGPLPALQSRLFAGKRVSQVSGLKADLRASTADGLATNVMVGAGENYLPAFVLALSGSQVASGLVSTVPLLAGAILQLVSPWAIRQVGSYRRWVVLCAAIQAIAFLPLLAVAWFHTLPTGFVFVCAAVYWATGFAGQPAWSNWLEKLVPERIRTPYFARRARFGQMGLLLGVVGGGLLLHMGGTHSAHLDRFALLFLAAAASRFVAVYYLSRQRELERPEPEALAYNLGTLARWAKTQKSGGLLLWSVLAMQAAVQVSGPYFAPYMLKHLDLSYGGYTVLVAVAFAAKVLLMPLFGRLADRWGARAVLVLCGIGIVPLPALWLVADSFVYLIGVQIFAGAVWAGYELAMLLLFFQAIPRRRRLAVLTLYNLAYAVAIGAGSLLGGLTLGLLGTGRGGYEILFALSTAIRFLPLVLLLQVVAWPAWVTGAIRAAGLAMGLAGKPAAPSPVVVLAAVQRAEAVVCLDPPSPRPAAKGPARRDSQRQIAVSG